MNLAGIIALLQQLAQAIIGPFGLAVVTLAVAGVGIAFMIHRAAFHHLIYTAIGAAILVGAGVIANSIAAAGAG